MRRKEFASEVFLLGVAITTGALAQGIASNRNSFVGNLLQRTAEVQFLRVASSVM
jgi:hypothetical protein